MAISWDSRKGPRSSSVEGSLPSSLANRYFDCQKTEGAGFKPPREAARSFNSREFCFEIWEREAAPAELMPDIPAIYGRLASESAAENIDGWRAQTGPPAHAAHGCRRLPFVCVSFVCPARQ